MFAKFENNFPNHFIVLIVIIAIWYHMSIIISFITFSPLKYPILLYNLFPFLTDASLTVAKYYIPLFNVDVIAYFMAGFANPCSPFY